jgi:hypothetical protein
MSDTWDLGEDIPIRLETRDENGTLTNADSTPTIVVTKPDNTALSPALTFSLTSTGVYDTELPAASTEEGGWGWVASATIGGVLTKTHDQFTVMGAGIASSLLYLDLEAFKETLSDVPAAIDGKGTLIERALRAACRKIDRECHRHFFAGPLTARMFDAGGNVYYDRAKNTSLLLTDDIATDMGVIVEVGAAFSATYTTLTSGTGYELWPLDAGSRRRPYEGISLPGRVAGASVRYRITARPGWPEVPDDIEMAAQILGSRYYNRRTSPEGTTSGSSEFGGAVPLRRTDPDVFELIKNFVRPFS